MKPVFAIVMTAVMAALGVHAVHVLFAPIGAALGG